MKKNLKKLIRLAALMLAAALLICSFACSGKKDDDDDKDDKDKTADNGKNTPDPAQSGDPGTLVPTNDTTETPSPTPSSEQKPTPEPSSPGEIPAQLLGSWTGTIDMTDQLNEEMGNSDSGFNVTFTNITLDFVMTFREDGTYTVEITPEAAEKLKNDLAEQMLPAAMDTFREAIAQAMGKDPEEVTDEEIYAVLSLAGYSISSEADLKDMLLDMMGDSMPIEDLNQEADFEVRGDKLMLEDFMGDGEIEYEYTLSANRLTLDLPAGETDSDIPHFALPLVLTKID